MGHPFPGSKYLRYASATSDGAGLLDRRYRTAALMAEAEAMGRIPILPQFTLAPQHNRGRRRPAVSLQKYFSLERFRVVVGDFVEEADFDVTEVESTDQVRIASDAPDERIRKRTAEFLGTEDCRFLPSAQVSSLANQVIAQMGASFVGLHVRRGDKLSLLPELDRDTSPESILAKIRPHLADHAGIYLASNESQPGFFGAIEAQYPTRTWRTFDCLNIPEIYDDNYLLFAVEMAVLMEARLTFYTFQDSSPVYYRPEPAQYLTLVDYSMHPRLPAHAFDVSGRELFAGGFE